nr:uncharacterized protein ppp1r3aa [Misgurnus anguillicaudatus]
MSAQGLVPDLDSCTCRDWMRHGQQKEKMPDQTPAGDVEDESDESVEPELPPTVIRRKVSFADAFGLDLVSVKEFDNRDSSGPGDLARLLGAEGKVFEEYYLSCPFTCPASDQELRMRLQEQKLELESIELLPGSTTIRGTVRVLNLCFHKAVYVHTTLDGWQSHFDLLAEYVPGSSDGETDRFSFRLMLTPPFGAEGMRVEFCLRYESQAGTFWANNRGTNYIVFCHQRWRAEMKDKENEKEREREKLIEENNNRGIRSCLKTNSKVICTETTPTEMGREISEQVTSWTTRTGESKAEKITQMTSPKSLKDCCTPLVDRRRKRRTARLAHKQDCFSQKQMEPKLVDFSHTIEGTRDWSTPKLSIPNIEDVPIVQSRHDMDTPPILTFHQIPLLSLDWVDKTTSPAYAKPHDVCDEINTENRQDEDHTTSACQAWEAFLGSDDTKHAYRDTQDQDSILCLDGETQQSLTTCKRSVESSAWEILQSSPTETSRDWGVGPFKDYQHWEEPRSTTSASCESEPEKEVVWFDHQTHKYMSSAVTLPEEEAQSAHDLKTPKGVDGISPEVFMGHPDTSNTPAKVKENTRSSVNDTLTFTKIRDEPFTDRQTERLFEKQDLNKASKLDSGEQVDSEFYTGLRGEEMESVQKETQNCSWCESQSNLRTLKTNVNNPEPQKDEERRFELIRETQGMDVEDELPTLPIIQLSCVGSASSMGSNSSSSRLLSWWRDFWSLGHVTRALVCSVVLFVIFVTAYLCDLPTCLALYLFSLCWWCSQGVKQRLDSAIDVD